MKTSLLRWCAVGFGWLLVLPSTSVFACSVCMGGGATGEGADGPNGTTGDALNGAIFTMLGCIFSMLALIATVGISFVVRARRTAETQIAFQSLAFDQ